jgi:hypothetical protein
LPSREEIESVRALLKNGGLQLVDALEEGIQLAWPIETQEFSAQEKS